jgi:uncharacterized membrane protein
MIIYGFVKKLFAKLDDRFVVVAFFALYILARQFLPTVTDISPYIFPFGLFVNTFSSSDYYPIFPHIFLFLAGTGFGGIVKDNKLPNWFYDAKIPFLPIIGRWSLVIYIVHQPVLIGLFWIFIVGWFFIDSFKF